MDKRYAYYVYVGAAIGLLFGGLWASSTDNSVAVLYAVLAGAGVGWFIAAARSQGSKEEKKTDKQ